MTSYPKHGRGRKATALATALALSVLGIFGFAGSALADPVGDINNINSPDAGTGSIVVHKYEKTSTNGSTAGNGTQVTPTGNAIPGVTFMIKEVLDAAASLPLLTNAGWVRANTIETGFAPATAEASLTGQAGVTLTAGTSLVTDINGTLTFPNLHYGLYLIQETAAPSNVTNPALPFLVTIPFPTGPSNATNPNEWLYQVHVYPKNGVTGLTKVVNTSDSGFHTAGDYVSWTITSNVPVLASGGFNTYTVTDTINTAQLQFVTVAPPTGISPRGIKVFNAGGTDVTSNFTLTTDYTYSINGGGNIQTLDFTAAGRADLATYAQGGRIEFVVPTQVVAVPAGGNITNGAGSIVNSANQASSSSTDFGQLQVFKFAMTNAPGDTGPTTKTALAGATFQLYFDSTLNPGVPDASELVTVAGANSWTSDATGNLNISALKPGSYLLVETAAPVGYQLNTTPHSVTVVAGTSVPSGVNYTEVQNSQLPPWMLPFTGGNGVLTFTLIGMGLMALAFGLAFVAFRRRQANA